MWRKFLSTQNRILTSLYSKSTLESTLKKHTHTGKIYTVRFVQLKSFWTIQG